MIVKTIDLILEKVETNQKLLKELVVKVESLVKPNKPKKTKRTTNSFGNPKVVNPKPKEVELVKVEPDYSVDELIKMVNETPETRPKKLVLEKKPKKIAKKKIIKSEKKEIFLSDLIADLKKDPKLFFKPNS